MFYCYCCCLLTTASSAHDATHGETRRALQNSHASRCLSPYLSLSLRVSLALLLLLTQLIFVYISLSLPRSLSALACGSGSSLSPILSSTWQVQWPHKQPAAAATSTSMLERHSHTFLTLFDAADFGPSLATTLALTVAKQHGSFRGFVFSSILLHIILEAHYSFKPYKLNSL